MVHHARRKPAENMLIARDWLIMHEKPCKMKPFIFNWLSYIARGVIFHPAETRGGSILHLCTYYVGANAVHNDFGVAP